MKIYTRQPKTVQTPDSLSVWFQRTCGIFQAHCYISNRVLSMHPLMIKEKQFRNYLISNKPQPVLIIYQSKTHFNGKIEAHIQASGASIPMVRNGDENHLMQWHCATNHALLNSTLLYNQLIFYIIDYWNKVHLYFSLCSPFNFF